MDRRRFVEVAGAGLLVAATGAQAKPAQRIHRLGVLRPGGNVTGGASPADMPADQQTKFRPVNNQNAARAIGLTIPQPLLLRADEVIQ